MNSFFHLKKIFRNIEYILILNFIFKIIESGYGGTLCRYGEQPQGACDHDIYHTSGAEGVGSG